MVGVGRLTSVSVASSHTLTHPSPRAAKNGVVCGGNYVCMDQLTTPLPPGPLRLLYAAQGRKQVQLRIVWYVCMDQLMLVQCVPMRCCGPCAAKYQWQEHPALTGPCWQQQWQ